MSIHYNVRPARRTWWAVGITAVLLLGVLPAVLITLGLLAVVILPLIVVLQAMALIFAIWRARLHMRQVEYWREQHKRLQHELDELKRQGGPQP